MVGSSVGAKVGVVEGESAKEKMIYFFWRVNEGEGGRRGGGWSDHCKKGETASKRGKRGNVRVGSEVGSEDGVTVGGAVGVCEGSLEGSELGITVG
jgi:hypothetical protein